MAVEDFSVPSSALTKGLFSAPYGTIKQSQEVTADEKAAGISPMRKFLQEQLRQHPLFMLVEKGSKWAVVRRPLPEDADELEEVRVDL